MNFKLPGVKMFQNSIIVIIFLFLIPSVAFAEPIRHIGLELSNSCQLLQFSDKCGSNTPLELLFPETPLNPQFRKLLDDSSELSIKQNKPKHFLSKQKLDCIKNDYCQAFSIKTNQKVMYWINPDYTARNFLDSMITINPNMLNKNLNKTTNPIIEGENSRRITFEIHNLYISNCYKAIVNPTVLWKELGFVVYYMALNCQNSKLLGTFNELYSEPLEKHELDISTSPNHQAEQKLKQDMERCKQKC